MSRPCRLLTVLACAAGACALSAPAALAAQGRAASSGQGVVLSAAGHGARLVDRGHRVGDVRIASARGLRRGDVVTVRDGRAQVGRHVGKVSFLARVVHSSARGALVQLGDGSTLKLANAAPHGRPARAAAATTIDFAGLAAGQALLVTIATDARGNVVLAIKSLSPATAIGAGELHAVGVVTDDEGDGSFGIRADDGSGLRFDDPQQLFDAADAAWCDVVEVGYHRDGRQLVADALRVTGQSDEGDCADDEAGDEVDGTVTALAASALTIAPDDGSDATTIAVDDPSLLEGIEVGDDVAVTLDEDGTAIDIELLDWSDDPGDGGDE